MVSPSCLSACSGLSDCWFSTRSSHWCLAQRCRIEWKAKVGHPILVGQNEHPTCSCTDPIHQGKHLLALKVETAAKCFDPCIDDQSARSAGRETRPETTHRFWFTGGASPSTTARSSSVEER